MIDISQYLHKIKNERYAKDVRQAIYDAINGANTNLSEKGNFVNLGNGDASAFDNNQLPGTVYKVLTDTWYVFFTAQENTAQFRFSYKGVEQRFFDNVTQQFTEWTVVGDEMSVTEQSINAVAAEVAKRMVYKPISGTFEGDSVFNANQDSGTIYRATSRVNNLDTLFLFFTARENSAQFRFSYRGIEQRFYDNSTHSFTNWTVVNYDPSDIENKIDFYDLGENDDIRIFDMYGEDREVYKILHDGITYVFFSPDELGSQFRFSEKGVEYRIVGSDWILIGDSLNKGIIVDASMSIFYSDDVNYRNIYRVNNGLYIFGCFDEASQWRFSLSDGYETRTKVDGVWQEWKSTSVTENMLDISLRAKLNAQMKFVNLGSTSNLDEAFMIMKDNRDLDTLYSITIGDETNKFISISPNYQFRINSILGIQAIDYSDEEPTWSTLVHIQDHQRINEMWNAFTSVEYCHIDNVGGKSDSTSFDSTYFVDPKSRYIFTAHGDLASDLGISSGDKCELTYVDGYQVVQPVRRGIKIYRRVNSVYPTFDADPWIKVDNSEGKLNYVDLGINYSSIFENNRDKGTLYNSGVSVREGGIYFDFHSISDMIQYRESKLGIEMKDYSTKNPAWEYLVKKGDHEKIDGKLDYANGLEIGISIVTSKAALSDYNFDSDKLYCLYFAGGILGTNSPAQFALLFQPNIQNLGYTPSRLIIGFKSGVFHSEYDSQNETWTDPAKSDE